MAEYRTVRMSFWADPYVEALSVPHKLLYIYLFTGAHTNNLGLLEITERKISFETGASLRDVAEGLTRLEQDGKLIRDGQKIWLTRFIRHQTTTSEKLLAGLRKLIHEVGSTKICKELLNNYPELFDETAKAAYGIDTVQIPHGYPIDTVSIPSGELEREKEREEEEENILHAAPAKKTNEIYRTKKGRKLAGQKLAWFSRFWAAFAYQRGKAEAADAWLDIPDLTPDLVDRIVTAATAEAAARAAALAQGKTPKMAQGWIAGRRWEDEPLGMVPSTGIDVAAVEAALARRRMQ